MMKTSLSQLSELSGLNDDEVKRIASVIERDFKLRQKEFKRIQEINKLIRQEQDRIDYLTRLKGFNNSQCVRCFKQFRIFLNPKKICSICKSNVCQQCAIMNPQTKMWSCRTCLRLKELELLTADWFYVEAKKKFKRCGSAKVVRELYKREKEFSDVDEDLGYGTLNSSYVVHDKNLQNELDQYSKRLLFLIENLQADVSQKKTSKVDLKDDQQLITAEICRARTALSGPVRRAYKQLSPSYESDLQNLIIQKTEEILHINLQQLRKNEKTENFDQKLAETICDKYVKKEALTNPERQSLVPTTRTNFSSLGFESRANNENFRRMSLLRTPAVQEEDTEEEEGDVTPTKDLNKDHDQHSMDTESKLSEPIDDCKTNTDLIESKTVSSDSDEPREYTTWL